MQSSSIQILPAHIARSASSASPSEISATPSPISKNAPNSSPIVPLPTIPSFSYTSLAPASANLVPPLKTSSPISKPAKPAPCTTGAAISPKPSQANYQTNNS